MERWLTATAGRLSGLLHAPTNRRQPIPLPTPHGAALTSPPRQAVHANGTIILGVATCPAIWPTPAASAGRASGWMGVRG
jgi:hypothetical protein